ncbi:MAG: anaerobic sulfatase maturase [Candidatus Aminicenantes bacterium]|nr:MAG: anaerobic sulfatase maturase [Candidatus Aminicenantes bacterium]
MIKTKHKKIIPGFHLLAKPTGAVCNLDCQYCFFLSKEALYPGSRFRMSEELLKIYIKQLFAAHYTQEVTVAWQGGEPTMMGLDYFRRAAKYAEDCKKTGQRIIYTLQTNGTLLDDEWCAFLKEHDFLVGLSIDGPREMHDAYRVDKGGKGSFDRVVQGWEFLNKHNVEVNILCAVHAANETHPLEVYRFFRDTLGADFIQFIPIVEPVDDKKKSNTDINNNTMNKQDGSPVTDRSVRSEQYGQFLIDIFEEWVRRDVGRIFVQLFDVALGNWIGQHTLCAHSPTCGGSLVLEHNGDIYSCDHFVAPAYRLGNIKETHMIDLVASHQQLKFGEDKLDTLPGYCKECELNFSCYGGCPKDRFIKTPDGEPGLNYLCAGYKAFFKHIAQPMKMMAELLSKRQNPDNIMNWYAVKDAK